jgi:hypothetical protein
VNTSNRALQRHNDRLRSQVNTLANIVETLVEGSLVQRWKLRKKLQRDIGEARRLREESEGMS